MIMYQSKTWQTKRIETCVMYTRGKSLFHLTVWVLLSITVMNVQVLKHGRSPEGTVNEMLLHYDIIKHVKRNRSCRSKLQLICWARTDGSSDMRNTGKKAWLSQYGWKPSISISREEIPAERMLLHLQRVGSGVSSPCLGVWKQNVVPPRVHHQRAAKFQSVMNHCSPIVTWAHLTIEGVHVRTGAPEHVYFTCV